VTPPIEKSKMQH